MRAVQTGRGGVVPLRLRPRGNPPTAPSPFSREWVTTPPAPVPAAPPRRVAGVGWTAFALPRWVPSERALGALLVLALVAVTAYAGPESKPTRLGATAPPVAEGVGGGGPGNAAALLSNAADQNPTATTTPDPTALPAPVATATATTVPAFEIAETAVAVPTDDGALLPGHRILTYYGHPHSDLMGILGEYSIEDLHAKLKEQAEGFAAADPSTPVKLGFEVIASVAQRDPGEDGKYLLYTDEATIQEYIDYATANDMVVFLDYQIGMNGVANEIEEARKWLELPNVHLALDPEFAMAEGEQPGEHIGQIDATDVAYAQQTLVDLAADAGIPPKILLIHQFHFTMLTNKDQISPMTGVQLILNADGFGEPATKLESYAVLVAEEPIEFHGFKLFYKQDFPLMSPEEILALEPAPHFVVYQ
ncbi:MAG: hypothetical protein AVDCRST_MAG73-1669 [uncultured Thermomicrobiales bacterium]|uniref:Lipoprotein n=1 Tax=uncultured Thermomicrobiales bacterium TaxID=1645740 RepID=A0A6J4U2Q6_9BACT|nr:MAG: hypothetical protein AVDCRST_MAG73-1669 [uncultured Thermomicrobiales bacterium]